LYAFFKGKNRFYKNVKLKLDIIRPMGMGTSASGKI